MPDETLMTEAATTTTESPTASQPAATNPEGQQPADKSSSGETQQVAEQPKQAAEGETPEAAKPEGAPEKYDFAPPEGQTFDPQVISKFSETAKKLNLSQDAAQTLLNDMSPVMQARQAEVIQTARVEWANAAKADKEFGGDKLAQNMDVAKAALAKFGSPEFISLLKETGLGDHPEVVRVFYRAGKAISDDSVVTGSAGKQNAGGAGRQSPAENHSAIAAVLYPT